MFLGQAKLTVRNVLSYGVSKTIPRSSSERATLASVNVHMEYNLLHIACAFYDYCFRGKFVVCISRRPRPNDNKIPEENLMEVESWVCVFLNSTHYIVLQTTTFLTTQKFVRNVLNRLSFSKHSNRISRIWRDSEKKSEKMQKNEWESEKKKQMWKKSTFMDTCALNDA